MLRFTESSGRSLLKPKAGALLEASASVLGLEEVAQQTIDQS